MVSELRLSIVSSFQARRTDLSITILIQYCQLTVVLLLDEKSSQELSMWDSHLEENPSNDININLLKLESQKVEERCSQLASKPGRAE